MKVQRFGKWEIISIKILIKQRDHIHKSVANLSRIDEHNDRKDLLFKAVNNIYNYIFCMTLETID